MGIWPQTDGRFYVGAAPTVGRVSGTTLTAIADLMDQAGSQRLRLTAQQKLVILDVAQPDDLATGPLETLGLQVRPTEFRTRRHGLHRHRVLQLAIVETKARTADLVDRLEGHFGEKLDGTDLSIHVNGCPNSCAGSRSPTSASKVLWCPTPMARWWRFQVHLGGRLGPQAGFGRKLRALKVTADDVPDYVQRVLTNYTEQREDSGTLRRLGAAH